MSRNLSHRLVLSLGVASIAFLTAPLVGHAETVVRVADQVGVAEDQLVARDLYAVGNAVAVSGTVDGDVYALGGTVTANGSIAADLTTVGGSVQVHGPVGDDVRVLGGDVVVGDTVAGDVFVIGGSLRVLSSAEIAGDVFFYGGEATIEGSVGGRIGGSMEQLRVDAPVAGDVTVTVMNGLTLGERAAVTGDVTYTSTRDLVRAQGATVEGDIAKQTPPSAPPRTGDLPLLLFAAHLFALFIGYFLLQSRLATFKETGSRDMSKSAIFGVLALGGVPLLTLLLLVTGIGMLAGLVLATTTLALVSLAYLLAPILIITLVGFVRDTAIEVRALSIFVATTVFYGLGLVPLLGPALVLVLVIITGGVLVRSLYTSLIRNG